MRDSLDPSTRNDLITYRLLRANETLSEADYNAEGGFYYAAVSRLYYSCFYAALALLIRNNLEAGTHKGVMRMLVAHFIMNGTLNHKYGSILTRLYQVRQANDYEDFVYCDKEMYDQYRPMAEEFIEAVKSLIAEY